MAILSLNNISKSFIDNLILEDVSFNIENGDKIGLIGVNGSGKTTLFKILVGDLSFDKGDIYVQKNLKLGYLSQINTLNPNLTIYEECLDIFKNLISTEERLRELEQLMATHSNEKDILDSYMKEYSNLQEKFEKEKGYSYQSLIRGVLKGLGFSEEDFNNNTEILSGGQKARLELAKLLLSEPDMLLLDEPTNHLDIEVTAWLEKYLKDYKGALIVISHDRYFLNSFVNKVILLENHKTYLFKGNYETYIKERKKQIEQLKRQYEDQQKEIKRQEEIIKRFMNMGRDRFIRQGKSRQKLLDKMKIIEPPHLKKTSSYNFNPEIQSGKNVLSVENLQMAFDERVLFNNLNFNIYRHDKIGLIGGNGVGKSTLIKLIKGSLVPKSGKVSLGTKVQIGYFDQEMKDLNLDKTLIDEIWDEYPKLSHQEIRNYLAQFFFLGDDIFKFIDELSGGEKGRLSMLKLMLSKSNFLLMDEPTNHLDIDSKEVLEDALINYGGTLLVISHDRYFLNKVCNKIFALDKDGLQEFLGNYDYYVEKSKDEEEDEDIEELTKTQVKTLKKLERENAKELRQLKEKKSKLEKEITDLESKLQTLDEELSNPDIYQDFQRVQELSEKRISIEEDLELKYEMWIDYN